LKNFRSPLPKISRDLSLIPEPQRASIGNESKRSNCGKQQKVAHPEEHIRYLRSRNQQQHSRILWGDQERQGESKQAGAGKERSSVFCPTSLRVVLAKQAQTIRNKETDSDEICHSGDEHKQLFLHLCLDEKIRLRCWQCSGSQPQRHCGSLSEESCFLRMQPL